MYSIDRGTKPRSISSVTSFPKAEYVFPVPLEEKFEIISYQGVIFVTVINHNADNTDLSFI